MVSVIVLTHCCHYGGAKPVGVGAASQPLIPTGEQSGLRDRDVRGLQSLRTFDHIELHLRAFRQRAEAAGLNRAGVDEHILAPVSRDEAKAFRIVEPLDGSALTTHLRNSRKGPGNPSTGKLFREIYSFLERNDGKRFVVHADEKLTAFVELESAIRGCGELVGQVGEIFAKLGVAKPILNQAEDASR